MTTVSNGRSVRRHRLAFLLLCCLLWPGCRADEAPSEPQTDAGPNIVVVMLDTVRPDFLGFYGHQRETAPFLGKLARRSAVFRNAYSSSSWTAPAVASLFTSSYPIEHGIHQGFFANAHSRADGTTTQTVNRIPAETLSLPEILQEHGYKTFGATANINISEELGFSRGFDRFVALSRDPKTRELLKHKESASIEAVRAQIRAWEEEIFASDKYFLYVHVNDPHSPYLDHKPWLVPPDVDRDHARRWDRGKGWDRAKYKSEIGYVDLHLRELYETFGSSETLFVFVSDHGEAFGEHGGRGHGPPTGLWREVNQILLMVTAPSLGIVPGNHDVPVSIIDVLPTVLDLCCATVPERAGGVSLASVMQPGSPASDAARVLNERVVFAQTRGRGGKQETIAAIQRDWKLLDREGTFQLYNMATDPYENDDQIDDHAELAAILRAQIEAYRQRTTVTEEAEAVLDDTSREQLRRLGYID